MKNVTSLLFLTLILASCTKVIKPEKIQEKLVGDWGGQRTTAYSPYADLVTFSIEKDGNYSAALDYGSASVFDAGDNSSQHPDKKFVINYVDSFDKAHGTVTWFNQAGYRQTSAVSDLVFSNSDNKLEFFLAGYSYSLDRK